MYIDEITMIMVMIWSSDAYGNASSKMLELTLLMMLMMLMW